MKRITETGTYHLRRPPKEKGCRDSLQQEEEEVEVEVEESPASVS